MTTKVNTIRYAYILNFVKVILFSIFSYIIMWLYLGQDFIVRFLKFEVIILLILAYIPNIELQIYKAIEICKMLGSTKMTLPKNFCSLTMYLFVLRYL